MFNQLTGIKYFQQKGIGDRKKIITKVVKVLFAISIIVSVSVTYAFSSEEETNRLIQKKCAEQARNNSYTGGGPQVDPLCEQATSWACLAEALCGSYPSECSKMKQRFLYSCKQIKEMGYSCKACNIKKFKTK